MFKRQCEQCCARFETSKKTQIFCSVECRTGYNRGKHARDKIKHPPMDRNQALANAWLMDRSMQSIDELIEDVFKRRVGE